MRAPGHLPLYGKICLINGAVLLVGTLVLVLSPLSVSSRVLVSEAIVVLVGLAIMLLTNAWLIRRSLSPLDRMTRTLEGIDHLQPGDLPEEGAGPVRGIARSVELSLGRQGDAVVLEVRDDGRGFVGLVAEGSGLLGMRERAALVDAELTVTSQPRHGTSVRLLVPTP